MCVCVFVCVCKLGGRLVTILHVAWYMCTNNVNYGICTCAKCRSVDCSNSDKVQAMYSTCTLHIHLTHTHIHVRVHLTPTHLLSQARIPTSLTGSHPPYTSPHRLTPSHLPLHTHTPGFHAELFVKGGNNQSYTVGNTVREVHCP